MTESQKEWSKSDIRVNTPWLVGFVKARHQKFTHRK